MRDLESRTLQTAVAQACTLAERLFADLDAHTRSGNGEGFARVCYGEGEQYASDLVAGAAAELGLEIRTDYVGNLYVTMPGTDRSLPRVMTGSHLDSAIRGGNFDGGAGVAAGITALAALRATGFQPLRDITLLCTRAEESGSWFGGTHGGHLGCRAALGLLRPEELQQAVRLDTGRSLGEHIDAAGFSTEAFLNNPPWIQREKVDCWIELHIEQGPVLDKECIPVGIVTGIRGFLSARTAVCRGVWTHAGGTPEGYRHDAVLATVNFLQKLYTEAARRRESGQDLTLTVGRLFTNPELHSITKVPGEVSFSMDMRSHSASQLQSFAELARTLADETGVEYGVTFDLGAFSPTPAAKMDPALRAGLAEGAAALGIPAREMACGASHDTVDFVSVGIPSALIFLRNANGSHNPAEHIDADDFRQAATLLTWILARRADLPASNRQQEA